MSGLLGVGAILNDTYRLVQLVAEGGMGVVYEATHARLAGRYAIKVLTQRLAESDEGLAQFDCTIYQEVDAGDHVLVLLELHAVRHVEHAAAGTPLVFHRSAFGKLQQLG